MPFIAVENITKVYGSGEATTSALRGISFTVDSGEFVAIMGPSGSGKSTLLHILGLLDLPTAGAYAFDGKSVSEYTANELARLRNQTVGFIFQSFNLLPRVSVLENVMLPLLYSTTPEREWTERAHAAIARVDLTHRASHRPSQLSGGEQQRAAIARALVLEPRIIFADEPTGNLDSASGRLVMEAIEQLHDRDGRTVILITHESTTASHAERILHLRDGLLERDERVAERRRASEGYSK